MYLVTISKTQSVPLSRVCTCCGIEKDLSAEFFYWNAKVRQYEKTCIECRKAKRRDHYTPHTADGRGKDKP